MNNLNRKAEYVWNKEQFDNVDPADIDHLWGQLNIKYSSLMYYYEKSLSVFKRKLKEKFMLTL